MTPTRGGRSSALLARSLRAPGAALAACLSIPGCYHYVPVPLATTPPYENVRVRLTEAAAARLVPEFGAYTTELEGQLAPHGPDSLALSLSIARDYRGVTLDTAREVLSLGRSEVVQVQRRELSWTRTTLAVAGTIAAFALLVRGVTQLGDANPGSDGTTPPPPPGGIRVGVRLMLP